MVSSLDESFVLIKDENMIIKNDIPILEFDTDKGAIIAPTHEKLDMKLPSKCVFAFVGDNIEKYAKYTNSKLIGTFISNTKSFPVYVTKYKNEEIALVQAPVGASSATQLLDWLIGYGVKKIISAGSCGALKHFDEGVFLVPYKALRDEGTSYHYASPSRFIEINVCAREAIEKAFLSHGLKYQEVITWSCDGFFRETKEKVEYRKSEGCSVVEMECSALAACALFRSVTWGMILYTADTLENVSNYDERNWGGDVSNMVIELCLDALLAI